jgi:hypothetical protein
VCSPSWSWPSAEKSTTAFWSEGRSSCYEVDAAAVSNLAELLDLAKDEMVLLTTPEGHEFILTEVGELDENFDAELEALSRNREFMAFLEERSRETKRIPLAEVKRRLSFD